MITCNFIGRLGNLTFEILNVFRYAQKKEIPFECVVFRKKYKGTGLSHLQFKKISPFFSIDNYIEYNKEFFQNIYDHFVSDVSYNSIVNDLKTENYSVAFCNESIADNVILDRVPAAVDMKDANNQQLFRKLFYVDSLIEKNKSLYNDISERVAIHVRRTDYALYQNGKYLLNNIQLKTAISKMISDGQKKFIIFSDDIEWCKYNIKDFNSDIDITFHEPNIKSYNDLVLMSLCKRIYRNNGHSSFSAAAEMLRLASKGDNND